MQKFIGKPIIITGAGQGIGFTIARKLASEGASVILNDIDPILARRASQTILDEGGDCFAFPGDASDMETINGMVSTCVEKCWPDWLSRYA